MGENDHEVVIRTHSATSTKTYQNNYAVITFSEPLVVGMHAAQQVGCWANVGDVLPRVEDDTFYDFLWKEKDDLFAWLGDSGTDHTYENVR